MSDMDNAYSLNLNSSNEIIFSGTTLGLNNNFKVLTIARLSSSPRASSTTTGIQNIPDPSQQSVIETVTVTGESTTSIVLVGKFPEPIVNIVLNHVPISPSGWKQTPTSVTIPDAEPGNYVIQIFNGAVPLLPEQQIRIIKATIPTNSPAPQVTGAPTSQVTVETSVAITKPTEIKAFKVYFAMGSAKLNKSSKEAIRNWFEDFGDEAQMLNVTGFAQATPKGASLDPALSARRARAVANYLKSLGFKGDIRVTGAGRTSLNSPESRYVLLEPQRD